MQCSSRKVRSERRASTRLLLCLVIAALHTCATATQTPDQLHRTERIQAPGVAVTCAVDPRDNVMTDCTIGDFSTAMADADQQLLLQTWQHVLDSLVLQDVVRQSPVVRAAELAAAFLYLSHYEIHVCRPSL